ncbi:MAG: lipid-A-disaccharide synthase [Nitrospirota bacterium]|nr:MAG: lipid-A-disaccharide synthase [Nitrospirota bacterium]
MPRIFIVTGEASGDLHGGNLAREIYSLNPHATIQGVGGHHMIDAGVKLVPEIERVDAIGIPGVKQLLRGYRTIRQLKKVLRNERFDAVVFIDSPAMNLRLAKSAAKAHQRVIYYIAPQIWAWGARRLAVIKRVVNRVIVILPFEEALFRQAGVPADFVGHPLLDTMAPSYNKPVLREQFGLSKDGLVIGIVPGSREHEVKNFLSIMLGAAKNVVTNYGKVQFIIAQAPNISTSLILEVMKTPEVEVKIIPHCPNEVMAASDLLFIASGTATLQAAIIGTPMIIAYRVPWLTYQIGKRLVTIPYIGLVNIIAGKLVAPELIQHDMTPERLGSEALRLLRTPSLVQDMREAFQRVREAVGSPGASRRAAELVLKEIRA